MNRVDEYRRWAEACRLRARAMPNEEFRAKFMDLAEGWEWLAKDRERRLERQQRAEVMDQALSSSQFQLGTLPWD